MGQQTVISWLVAHRSKKENGSDPFFILRFNSGRIVFFAALALAPWCASAAPGELDYAFGVGGISRFGVGFGNDNAFALALQNDGKIVIAGESGYGNPSEFAVARLNADGTPDTAFGSGGRVLVPIGISGAARAVALDSSGRIVVAGSVPIPNTAGNSAFAAIRLNGDGALDPTFGVGGKLFIPVKDSAAAAAVAIDSAGNIILAGYATSYDIATYGTHFALVRLTPSGSLDPTFAESGIFTAPGAGIRAVAIDASERIVAAGIDRDGNGYLHYAVFRLLADGTPDSPFGLNLFALGPYDDTPESIALDSSGRIIVAGSSLVAGGIFDTIQVFSAIRLNGDGSLDTSFGTQGGAVFQLGPTTGASGGAVAVDPSGRVLIAGTYYQQLTDDRGLAVMRLDSAGTLDGTFGSSGVKMISESAGGFGARAIRLDAAGRIVLAGNSSLVATGYDFSVARLTSSGSVDATFGAGNTVAVDVGSAPADIQAIARQADGKLVAAGNCECGVTTEIIVARRNVDGSPDLSFGAGGRARISFDTGTSKAYGVAIDSAGRPIIAGSALSGSGFSNFAIVRLTSNGSLDSSFGIGGKLTVPVGDNNNSGFSVTLDSSGRILAAGSSLDIGTAQVSFAVIRLTSNGLLDGTFGAGGIAIVPLPVGTFNSEANTIAVDSQGRIVLAGMGDGLRVARLLANGSLDPAFGIAGTTVIPVSQTGLRSARDVALALASGGKIVVAGYDNVVGTGPVFLVARFNEDGTFDSSFGTGGVVRLSASPESWASFVHAVAVQPNGRIVIAGETWILGDGKRIAVARLNSDGTLDGTFSAGGMLILPVGTGDDVANAVQLDVDGSIIIAGDVSRAFGFLKLQGGDPPTVSDVVPSVFSFTEQTGLARGVIAESAPITVTGIDVPAQLSIVGGSYSINGASFTELPGAVMNGDQISVRLQTSYGYATPASATVTIGGVSDTFTATTAPPLTLAGVSILGPTSLDENASASYTAVATFSDDSTQSITPIWSVSGPASIDASGFLTAHSVSSDTQISVIANYTIGPVSSSTSLVVMIVDVPPVPDTAAPTIPQGLAATPVSGSRINLAWSASSDNVGVSAYQVFRGGVFQATVSGATSFGDTGLAATTLYSYTVAACDAAGNCSAPSSAVSATTLAVGQYYFEPKPEPGFNLFGNVLDVTLDVVALFGNQDPGMQVAGVTAYVESVWKWNSVQDRWAFYSPLLTSAGTAAYAAGGGYEVLATIDPGEGYWVKATQPLALPAQSGTGFTWNGFNFAGLPSGFNLISDPGGVTPSDFNLQVTEPAPAQGVVPTTNFRSLWAWDAVQMKWYFYAPVLEASGGLDAVRTYTDTHNLLHFQDYNRTLGVGMGFWVNRP